MERRQRMPPNYIPDDDWLVNAILGLQYQQTMLVTCKDHEWVKRRFLKAKRKDERANYRMRRFGDTFRITAPMTYYL